jgi:hypothetical protein
MPLAQTRETIEFTMILKKPHDFVSRMPDQGDQHVWAGYPDECARFTAFADSLVGLLMDGRWYSRRFTHKRLAVVVDFFSKSQSQAESSLSHGWNGALEFPMGCINTVRGRAETNEQNALIERHLSLIATGYTMRQFLRSVSERLIDGRTCNDRFCKICVLRWPRDLAMTIAFFAKLRHSTVHLFSRWQPSQTLTAVLRSEGLELRWIPLAAIPSVDLEINRHYSIWDGTRAQHSDFVKRFWGPS